MDPLSLGLAAAAVLATGFAEGFAGEAGADLWKAAKQLVGRLKNKLTPQGRDALDRIEQGNVNESDTVSLGREIAGAVQADADLRRQLERLVEQASADGRATLVIQQAFDQAKQINIAGPNFGHIDMG